MTPSCLRYLRMNLPAIAFVFLAACDTSQLFPPDARLPDGSTYSGDILDGLFHGDGIQRFASGVVYKGQFRDGYRHGQGELESPAGWRYVGEFQNGMMAGQGVLEDRGTRYEGEFKNDLPHGEGRFEGYGGVFVAEFAEGAPVQGQHTTDYGTYEGEFKDWQYHGQGSYFAAGLEEGMPAVSGVWENGQPVDLPEYAPQEPPSLLTEMILVEDRRRLLDQIDNLLAGRPGEMDAYFLAVGGDGTESVFMRDIEVARAGLQAQFDLENRTITLLNHRDYEDFPLASRPSIALALTALDERMDPDEDLLVVHLVSHGARDGQLLLRQPGIELPDLSPEAFAKMLGELNVRRKLLVVSACFSGQWIEHLKDSDTLILTSARNDRMSFGCGDDSEMTWFSKALYQTVGLSLADPQSMFAKIEEQIREWEIELGMEEANWSYPQFHMGDGFREWLGQRQALAAAAGSNPLFAAGAGIMVGLKGSPTMLPMTMPTRR